MDPTAASVRGACETVLFARGEIDMENCDELFAVIQPELGSDTCVVIDSSQVTSMDSSCLSVLIRAQRRQDELGGTFAVRRPSQTVRGVLALTGLEHLIRD